MSQDAQRHWLSWLVMGMLVSAVVWQGGVLTQSRNAAVDLAERFSYAVERSGCSLWDWQLKNGGTLDPADPVWRWRPESVPTMLGYDAADWSPAVGSLLDVMHSDDKPRVERALREHFNSLGVKPYEIEFRLRSKSGTYLWFYSRGAATFVNDRPVRMGGIMTSIHSLRDDLAQSRRLLEIAPTPLIACDDNYKIIAFNRDAETLTGWTAEELQGKRVDKLTDAEQGAVWLADLAALKHELEEVSADAQIARRAVDCRLVKKDGQVVVVRTSVRVVKYKLRFLFVFTVLANDQCDLPPIPRANFKFKQ